MEGLAGKKVTVFYDDLGRVSRKDGILTSHTETEYVLDYCMIIPKARVVRVEVSK
jgi:hypothetical protein